MRRRLRMGQAFLLAVLTAAGLLVPAGGAGTLTAEAAGERLLTLSMAQKSALANSPQYEKLESELAVKEASLTQAVKSIQAKKKNMSTFRWSPLLSFHFPEKPDLTEAYEFEFKPVQIQAEIDTVEHSLTDEVLAINEKVANLYVEIVVMEDSIAFNQERLDSMQTTLAKNRVRLRMGEANQNDIDTMETAVKTLNNKIATDTRTLEADKKKLSTTIGMDISTGYRFENPFVETKIERDQLDQLIEYTLDGDQNYYSVSMTATTNRIAVQTNYDLMSGQYGSKMGIISSYVNQALTGQKVNKKAFKKSYDEFLDAIDEPWTGYKRILFIKIPKEWFKGSLDGIRYVEDEPYALYEAALEYQDARLDQENEKASLSQQVEDNFNSMVSMRSSYLSLVEDVEKAREQLRKDAILNRLGELTYDEYQSSQEDYEDTQNEMLSALATYSQTLYSFDRLTCGGVTALLEGTDAVLGNSAGGQSYIEEETASGAYYYIESIIQDEEFRLGVSIPEDFEIPITDFELWCDGVQIGSRTDIAKTIRHLALSTDSVDEVKIRFYNGDEFVDDCEIDPGVTSGPLEIVSGYTTVRTEGTEIGTFTSETSAATGLVTITLQPKSVEEIQFYRIRNEEGNYLISDDLIPIGTAFRYPNLVQSSLDDLTIEFYESESTMKYTGHFSSVNRKLIKDTE